MAALHFVLTKKSNRHSGFTGVLCRNDGRWGKDYSQEN